jgi:hypothetical protein
LGGWVWEDKHILKGGEVDKNMPIYEERINVNYPLIAGVLLWALAVGLIPGIILEGLWWFAAAYIALTVGIIASFFQMKVELSQDKLAIRFGIIYRKVIEVEKIQDCSPYRIAHPIRTYGGWGLRKGRDGTLAITQAFVNEAIKLETAEQTFIISSRTPERFCDAIKSVKS